MRYYTYNRKSKNKVSILEEKNHVFTEIFLKCILLLLHYLNQKYNNLTFISAAFGLQVYQTKNNYYIFV